MAAAPFHHFWIFHTCTKGFNGILGMEHGNFFPGAEGERKLISAYQEVDKFI